MKSVDQATQLLAAHGVYALTAIFIFYLYSRVSKQLKEAAGTKQEPHFKRVHTQTVFMMFGLVLAACVIWVYANFFQTSVSVLRGEVTGLRQNLRTERDDRATPRFADLLELETESQDFYRSLALRDAVSRDSTLRWVFVAKDDVPELVFNFRQTRFIAAMPMQRSLSQISAFNVRQLVEERQEHCDAKLTIQSNLLGAAKDGSLRLRYEPDRDGDAAKLGRFLIRKDSKWTALEWESVSPNSCAEAVTPKPLQQHARAPFDLPSLFRSIARAEAAPPPNETDRRGLWAALGSTDVQRQLAARRELLAEPATAKALVSDWLRKLHVQGPEDVGYTESPADAIHNVSVLVDSLEERGERFPPETYVHIAFAHYVYALYRPAWHYFEAARGRGFKSWNAGLAFAWAHSSQEIGEYEKAIAGFEQARSLGGIAGHEIDTAIAITYSTWQRASRDPARQAMFDAKVKEHYQRALKDNPDNPSANNGLAYRYALQGERLDEALALIDRALTVLPNDPAAIDTKGWVLFKMKRYKEALPLIERAVRDAPDRTEHHEHLNEVRAALAGAGVDDDQKKKK